MNTPIDDVTRAHETLTVVRCQLGERDAFADLVETWHRPLLGFVAQMAPAGEVDDIVQTVWLRVVRGLPRLRDPVAFPAWLFSIARRTVVDRYRYDRPDLVEPVPVVPDETVDTSATDLTAREVVHAVEGLPPLEREVVHLHYLADLSIGDVAAIVGAPAGTVKSRLSRGRRLLEPLLAHLDPGENDDKR